MKRESYSSHSILNYKIAAQWIRFQIFTFHLYKNYRDISDPRKHQPSRMIHNICFNIFKCMYTLSAWVGFSWHSTLHLEINWVRFALLESECFVFCLVKELNFVTWQMHDIYKSFVAIFFTLICLFDCTFLTRDNRRVQTTNQFFLGWENLSLINQKSVFLTLLSRTGNVIETARARIGLTFPFFVLNLMWSNVLNKREPINCRSKACHFYGHAFYFRGWFIYRTSIACDSS